MSLPITEAVSSGVYIDARSAGDAAAFLLDGQLAAIDAVKGAVPALTRCAQRMATAIRADNSLHYAAAGSSGLMALADASELRGTFGIPTDQIYIHMAGGVPVDGLMPGDSEDDGSAVAPLVAKMRKGDVAVVLTASGTTPFALEISAAAQRKGVTVIGIANNPDTPLLEMADEPVCIETQPEVVAGSTRLGAGTAQKAALNLMSTLMGIELGHVFRGEMVNVVADNAKLVQRSTGMVSRIAGVPAKAAEAAIAQTQGQIKPAILVATGCQPERASELLEQHHGQLGPCLTTLQSNQTNVSN